MMIETKQDVFERALTEWDDYVHSWGLQGEEAHGGCEFDPILIKYMKDYDAALPDETDKQKNCPYCHSKSGHKISQDAYSFWYRNKIFKPLFCSNCGRKL